MANLAFYSAIISFRDSAEYQWQWAATVFGNILGVLINKAHQYKCYVFFLAERRRKQQTDKNAKESLLLLLRWEYKYFWYVGARSLVPMIRFDGWLLLLLCSCVFASPRNYSLFSETNAINVNVASFVSCALGNVIYPKFFPVSISPVSNGSTVSPSTFCSSNFPVLFCVFFLPIFIWFCSASVAPGHTNENEIEERRRKKQRERQRKYISNQYLQRLLFIRFEAKFKFGCLNFFSLISKNKVLTSISVFLSMVAFLFIFHFIVVISVPLLLLLLLLLPL